MSFSARFLRLAAAGLGCGLPLLLASKSRAVTVVSPAGVNVRSQGPTSVFITYQGTAGQTSTQSFWCSRVVPGIGPGSIVNFNPCVPGTLLGSLPAQFNLSGASGASNFTDIMTIPETISRKAYQQGGGFFYIRKFSGSGPDQYAVVTCRLGLGGARSPLSVVNLELKFDDQDQTEPVTFFESTSRIKPFSAIVKYNGTGRLVGSWQIVQPGDPEPTPFDLLPAGSLPFEKRSQQTAYRVLAPFDIYLPPTGSAVIKGPDPRLLDTGVIGDYRILFRLNASPAADSFSDTGSQVVAAGGVSGFSFPFLRYFIRSESSPIRKISEGGASSSSEGSYFSNVANVLSISASVSQAPIPRGDNAKPRILYSFSWTPQPGATRYVLLFRLANGEFYKALLRPSQTTYEGEPFWLENLDQPLEWQVVAYGDNGAIIAQSIVNSLEPDR